MQSCKMRQGCLIQNLYTVTLVCVKFVVNAGAKGMLGNSIQAEKSSEQNGSIQWGLQNIALHQKGKPSIFFF